MGRLIIKTELYFYPSKQGKENRIFYNRYRPAFKIRDDNMFNSGQIEFIDDEKVSAGETAIAFITFLVPKHVEDHLVVNKKFTFYEGNHIIGEGKILDILI